MGLGEGGRCGPVQLPWPDILKEGKWNGSLTLDLRHVLASGGVSSDWGTPQQQ